MKRTILSFVLALVSLAGFAQTTDTVSPIETFENGLLVIIRNGIRYDVTGVVIRQ